MPAEQPELTCGTSPCSPHLPEPAPRPARHCRRAALPKQLPATAPPATAPFAGGSSPTPGRASRFLGEGGGAGVEGVRAGEFLFWGGGLRKQVPDNPARGWDFLDVDTEGGTLPVGY